MTSVYRKRESLIRIMAVLAVLLISGVAASAYAGKRGGK